MAFGLVKAGYGTAEEILRTPADLVLDLVEFQTFASDYEKMHAEINREEKR